MKEEKFWVQRFIQVLRYFQEHGRVMEDLSRVMECDFIGTKIDNIIGVLPEIVIDYCGASPDAMPDEFYEELFELMEGFEKTSDERWTEFYYKWKNYGAEGEN